MARRYFTPETLDFLQDLDLFNERSWFHANKDRYETAVREPMLELIEDLREPLHKKVSRHLVCDARKQGGSMFRINRDVRFSKDKSPYKTQATARFGLDVGRDVHAPGLYLHIEPGNCFMGAGIWMPPTDVLRRTRQAMLDAPKKWTAVRDAKALQRWEWGSEALKRAPQGIDPDHPLIDDLRLKSLTVFRPFTEKQVTSTRLLDLFVTRAVDTKPLMAWTCRALGVAF